MDVASFVAMFLPMMTTATERRRRFPQTITSMSIITGTEIVLKVPAHADWARRIRRSQKAPAARPLNLTD